ncbi:hypothetical protein [Aureliella helgolandensis]|uniref:MurG-like transferase n=1 Tax=Aureliella helgolandensis TaxID=2527968 RepID=A0A518G4I0_9BACT|nr:hypothetical protein [Aureliella helgolandensis]QDV23492.1 MurG-like transferase [Aureliella helgolandensis]
MHPIVVTSGVDSEYVLGGFAEHLRSKGYVVHEIDFGASNADFRPLLESLSSSKVAFVTSSHANLTSRTARMITPLFWEKYPNYLAPLEILPILKPQVSVYVPHDLLSPFGDRNLDEYRFLDLFDHLLAPQDFPELQTQVGQRTQVHSAGWIKYRAHPVDQPLEAHLDALPYPRISFMISSIQFLTDKYGPAGLVQYYKSILTKGVRVKLPVWSGVEQIEEAIRNHTEAEVIDSHYSSASLIAQSDLVVCNAASSILAESILAGVPGICLLDDEAESAELKIEKLREYPQLVFHDYRSRAAIPTEVLDDVLSQKLAKRLKPIDYDFMESLICV